MATIKLGTTKGANKALSYAEKRAEVAQGMNCAPEVVKAQMRATRALHGKEKGIQAHTVIQSFKPGEVTPEQANEIGLALAKEMAPTHESMIYTHTDKDHIHNHIIINSVDIETGKKYQAHGKQAIDQIREKNDQLCREQGLSVPEKGADMRYTLAESEIAKKNEWSWKDEIREKVDVAKEETSSMKEFQSFLQQQGIDVVERGKNITFLHQETKNKVRGSRLGEKYEKETIVNEFEKSHTATTVPSFDWDAFARKTEEERRRQADRAVSRTHGTDGKTSERNLGATKERSREDDRESSENTKSPVKKHRSYGKNRDDFEL